MKKTDWELLANHLTGVASKKEEEELAEWIARSEENSELYARVTKIWSAGCNVFPKLDVDRALNRVWFRIRQRKQFNETSGFALKQHAPGSNVLSPVARLHMIRVAAALVVAVGGIYLLTILFSEREKGTVSLTFSTIQSIEFSDGTRATCDVGSTITYTQSLADARAREVLLDGEAYFDVAKDSTSPFIIRTGIGRVEVLGTKLNVRAWRRNAQVVLAVQEGVVSFQSEGNDDVSKVVYLTKNEASRLTEGQFPSPPESVDISRYLSWMNKEIYFKNTPVAEVLDQLERWYNVTIEIADSSMLKFNITVFIENRPLVENLELISLVMNVQYVRDRNTIRIVPH